MQIKGRKTHGLRSCTRGTRILIAWTAVIIWAWGLTACGAPPPPVSPEPPPPLVESTPPPKTIKKTMHPLGSVEASAAAAKWVITGKVGKRESKWVNGKIVTTADIRPISVLKGTDVPSPISVSFLGGSVGPIRQDYSHEIVAVNGETAVFFLINAPTESGATFSGLTRIARKIPLLAPGQADSRLENNRRLVRFQNEIIEKVKKGAN